MADTDSTTVASTRTGLPMQTLIGAPLAAAIDAQAAAMQVSIQQFKNLGFNEDGTVKQLEFNLEQTVNAGANTTTRRLGIRAPLLSLFPVTGFFIDELNIQFDMQVNAIVSQATNKQQEKQTTMDESNITPAQVIGNVSSSHESRRSTDQSARYSVSYRARKQPISEGMSRVLDILASSIEPVPADSADQQ